MGKEKEEHVLVMISKEGDLKFNPSEPVVLSINVSSDVPKELMIGILEGLINQIKSEINGVSSIKTQGDA